MYAHVVALGAARRRDRGRVPAEASRPPLFAVGFAYVELIDAALYLNHYWFVTLAAVLLAVLPGRPRRSGRSTVPAVRVWALRGQIAVVYVFAGIAKLNADWLLAGRADAHWLAARTDRPVVGPLARRAGRRRSCSAGPAPRSTSRSSAGCCGAGRGPSPTSAVVIFHVATAMLFQIGVFPWVMIACTPIFFDPDWPRSAPPIGSRPGSPRNRRPASGRSPVGRSIVLAVALVALVVLAAVNVVLPLRHYWRRRQRALQRRRLLPVVAGDAHRASRVPRVRRDRPRHRRTWTVEPGSVLTEWQTAQALTRPDLALATAHLVAEDFARRGVADVEVRADSWVAFNGRSRQRWIDPSVDLATVSRFAPAADYVLPLDPPCDERPQLNGETTDETADRSDRSDGGRSCRCSS